MTVLRSAARSASILGSRVKRTAHRKTSLQQMTCNDHAIRGNPSLADVGVRIDGKRSLRGGGLRVTTRARITVDTVSICQ